MVRTSGTKKVGDLEVARNISASNVSCRKISFTGTYGNYIMENGTALEISHEVKVSFSIGSPPSEVASISSGNFTSNRPMIIKAGSSPAIEIDASAMPNEIVIKDTSTNNTFTLQYDGSNTNFILYDAANNITDTILRLSLSQITVSKKIIPSATVDLGDDTHRFRTLYLSGNILNHGGASLAGELIVGSTCSIGGSAHIAGNLTVDGSLSVGGTKNASIPPKSYPNNMDLRIRCGALESPFWSGIYIVDKITTQNGVYEYQLPLYFREAVDLNHLFVILTPEGKFVQYYYEIQDDKIIVHSSEDATFTIMVIGRRWDNEVIEDLRKEVWMNEFEGASQSNSE